MRHAHQRRFEKCCCEGWGKGASADRHAHYLAPFWLTLEEQGIDSQTSTTYVGTEIDGRFVVLQIRYDSLGVAPNGANVVWFGCTSFAVASECDVPIEPRLIGGERHELGVRALPIALLGCVPLVAPSNRTFVS